MKAGAIGGAAERGRDAPGWIRLSYAASMEKLKEAMDQIKRVG